MISQKKAIYHQRKPLKLTFNEQSQTFYNIVTNYEVTCFKASFRWLFNHKSRGLKQAESTQLTRRSAEIFDKLQLIISSPSKLIENDA